MRLTWFKTTALAAMGLALAGFANAAAKDDVGEERELYSQGAQLMAEQDWAGAAKKFGKAIEVQKDFSEAYDQRGLCLFNQGKTAEGVTDFKHAVAINPRLTSGWYHLGLGFEALKRDEKAADAYRRALGVEPMADEYSVVHTHYSLSLLLKRQAIKANAEKPELGEAIAHMEKAVAMDADFSEAHNELGRYYYLIGRYPEAIDQYTQAINQNADFAEAWSNRGVACWADGNWELALENCLKATELDYKFAGGHYNLGEVLYAHAEKLQSQDKASMFHDEAKKAVDEYRLAVELDPSFVPGWLGLGKACRGYHDFEGAKKAYAGALKADKKNKEAKLALAEIKSQEKGFVDHMPKPKKKAE